MKLTVAAVNKQSVPGAAQFRVPFNLDPTKGDFQVLLLSSTRICFIEPTLDRIMDPNRDGPEPCVLHNSSAEQSTVTTLANLPHEVIFKILSYLPAEDLSAVSQTCRHLNSASFADLLWQRLCEPYSIPTHSPFPCWRDLYTLRLHNWGFLLGIWCSDRKPRGIMILSLFSMLNRR